MFLGELAGRFWKLTLQVSRLSPSESLPCTQVILQLVSRYRTWLHSVVPKYVPPTARPLDGAPARVSHLVRPLVDLLTRSYHQTPISSPNGTRPGTPSPPDDAALVESTLRRLTVLIADSQLMVKKVSELFQERITGLMPGEEDGTEGSSSSEGPFHLVPPLILSDLVPFQRSLLLSHLYRPFSPRCRPRLS